MLKIVKQMIAASLLALIICVVHFQNLLFHNYTFFC